MDLGHPVYPPNPRTQRLTVTVIDDDGNHGCRRPLCLNDALALADKMSSQLSCSMSQADMITLAAEMQSMPPSCQSFSQKCPKLMGSSSSGASTIP